MGDSTLNLIPGLSNIAMERSCMAPDSSTGTSTVRQCAESIKLGPFSSTTSKMKVDSSKLVIATEGNLISVYN